MASRLRARPPGLSRQQLQLAVPPGDGRGTTITTPLPGTDIVPDDRRTRAEYPLLLRALGPFNGLPTSRYPTLTSMNLSRFISRLGEKGLPFYKLLKKVDKFQWTSEAQEALDALKKFLTTPPVLKPPRRATPTQPAEDLLLYISCTTHVVSTALVVE